MFLFLLRQEQEGAWVDEGGCSQLFFSPLAMQKRIGIRLGSCPSPPYFCFSFAGFFCLPVFCFFFTVDILVVVSSVAFLFVDTAPLVVFPPPLAAPGVGLVVFHPLITTSLQTLSRILLGSSTAVVAWLGCGLHSCWDTFWHMSWGTIQPAGGMTSLHYHRHYLLLEHPDVGDFRKTLPGQCHLDDKIFRSDAHLVHCCWEVLHLAVSGKKGPHLVSANVHGHSMYGYPCLLGATYSVWRLTGFAWYFSCLYSRWGPFCPWCILFKQVWPRQQNNFKVCLKLNLHEFTK